MPYFKTSQEWLDQSAALLEARPATTRVTTRYSIKPVKPRKSPASDADESAAASEPKPPRASLVLKTFDPISGVTLKYRTAKAAEVSWLVYASLGRLGRGMAGVPEVPEETMRDADAAGTTETGAAVAAAAGAGAATTTITAAAAAAAGEGQQQQGGGAGKKKKKGKK